STSPRGGASAGAPRRRETTFVRAARPYSIGSPTAGTDGGLPRSPPSSVGGPKPERKFDARAGREAPCLGSEGLREDCAFAPFPSRRAAQARKAAASPPPARRPPLPHPGS